MTTEVATSRTNSTWKVTPMCCHYALAGMAWSVRHVGVACEVRRDNL